MKIFLKLLFVCVILMSCDTGYEIIRCNHNHNELFKAIIEEEMGEKRISIEFDNGSIELLNDESNSNDLYGIVLSYFDNGADEIYIEGSENFVVHDSSNSRGCSPHHFVRCGNDVYQYSHLHPVYQNGAPDSFGYVDCDVYKGTFACEFCN